jgi:geranylgeranyl diphosphate synthase type I
LNGYDGRLLVPARRPERPVSFPGQPYEHIDAPFEVWRNDVRSAVLAAVADFLEHRSAADLRGVDIAREVLVDVTGRGKCLRSTFMYLGWLCGPESDAALDPAALQAAAGLELLHTFALLQDDVMDDSPIRRAAPSAHVTFADWHRKNHLGGSPERFGASAAVLLGDLCLVWAEQMMRDCGLPAAALTRTWPRYDAMRIELAVGQFGDLVNDARGLPTLDAVLDVARRKSGNYTVRRPLEIGAVLAGCGERVLDLLGRYGDAVGEAFQLRDDLLGIFGEPEVTGKPAGGDLLERKATSVVVAAHHLADPESRRQLAELMAEPDLGQADVDRWRDLIAATGAVEWIEDMISERMKLALKWIHSARIDEPVRTALANMAAACTQRAS